MWTLMISLLMALGSSAAVEGQSEFVGQVVCSACWFEADRTRVDYGTPGDVSCAARCAAQDIPRALAVQTDSGFELLLLEGERDWTEWIAGFAKIQGTTEERDGKRVLRVASVEAVDQSPWSSTVEDDAPVELSWTDLGGHAQSLEAYRGRIVVLNFWATWCAPCRKEMPDLVRIQNRYGMYGVQVVGAAADPPAAGEPVTTFARKLKMNFPVLLGADSDQMQALGVGVALPATVVIDRHGHVVERISGVFDPDELEALLDRLIKGEHAEASTKGEHVHVATRTGGTQASLVPS